MESVMRKVLCSTGALIGKPNGRDFHLLESLAGRLKCDGFEFMMYSDWYDKIEELIAFLLEEELCIPVVHCQKSVGEFISKGGVENFKEAFRRFELNCMLAERIGAKKLVMHLWDGETSDKFFQNNVDAYPQVLEISRSHGVDLLVENVVCNQKDPMLHWCELAEKYPDIHFVFDTKMAAFHSQLEFLYSNDYAWLWKEGHIRHYHVNDYGGGHMDWKNLKTLPMGKGHVDFDKFFEHIRSTGYEECFTVESTAFDSTGAVDVDMLNVQFERIRNYTTPAK